MMVHKQTQKLKPAARGRTRRMTTLQTYSFKDRRPETAALQRAQEQANRSPVCSKSATLQAKANQHSSKAAPNGIMQLKKLPNISIAADLALGPERRKTLFTAATLEKYKGQLVTQAGPEGHDSHMQRLLQNDLSADTDIDYNLINSELFRKSDGSKLAHYAYRNKDENEIMFLLKGDLVGVAPKENNNDVHPRIFGGNPDVDMAGTIKSEDIHAHALRGRNISDLSLKDKRKCLLDSKFGKITFTNNSGHFKFTDISDDVKQKLTSIIRSGDQDTEDLKVEFQKH